MNIINTLAKTYQRYQWSNVEKLMMEAAYIYKKDRFIELWLEESNQMIITNLSNLYEIINYAHKNDLSYKFLVSTRRNKSTYLIQLIFPEKQTKSTKLQNIYFQSEARYFYLIANLIEKEQTNRNQPIKHNEFIDKINEINSNNAIEYHIGKLDESDKFQYNQSQICTIIKDLIPYSNNLKYRFKINNKTLTLLVSAMIVPLTLCDQSKIITDTINCINDSTYLYESSFPQIDPLIRDSLIIQRTVDILNFEIQKQTNNYQEENGVELLRDNIIIR